MTNLFENTDTQQKTTPAVDLNETYYDKLVGNGKKFLDNEALAKAKVESDAFILRLQEEANGLRNELNTRLSVEEIINKMSSDTEEHLKKQVNLEQTNQQMLQQQKTEENKPSYTQEDIEKLVNAKLTEAENKRVHNANLTLIRETLKNKWGNDYVSQLKAKALELGLGEEFLQNLAKEQPKAFLKLIDANEDKQQHSNNSNASSFENKLFSPPSNSRPNTSFTPNSGERTQSYYNKLKSTNPSEYWSPRVQNQMHQDALRLEERFFDT